MQYGLIGEHLPHSHSPKIHRMLGNSNYTLCELAPNEVADFMKKRDFLGINVTIPYKQTVMPLCDCLDSIAVEIGAVNTVVNCGGSLFGTNTDFYGFIFMCNRAGIDFSGKRVLILGSGGTSKTVTAAAKHLGASDVRCVSRSGELNYENVYDIASDTNVIVNTTPCGMYPRNSEKPIELSKFPHLTGFADVVYNPLRTRLVQEATALGIPNTGGLNMLVAQAAFADKYFRDVVHSGGKIAKIVGELEKSLSNVVFIGMPGCGKSTVAKLLASKMKKRLYDIDSEIVKAAEKSIPEIFETEGEAAFRDMESEVTRTVTEKGGNIIACGGGTVLREENRECLRQNGFIIYIDRDLDKLARGGRPLSSGDDAVKKLFEERSPIYRSLADVTVKSDGSVEEVLDKVIKEILK